jgi:hypothetical protein
MIDKGFYIDIRRNEGFLAMATVFPPGAARLPLRKPL